ncbi:ABC transporter B family member 15-like isoform X1 [Ziziphus jujuba]|uniref:ABC transporter B family member 15-like isoform X1 n=1 Tax=Ziziphus jujuba TaxID=326968 RepID=A0A6P6FKM6_ZIZJJ|nr:ABC transporter B family member 15-like isoform X1 [Ziziphus jujuba]
MDPAEKQKEVKKKEKIENGSIRTIFMHANKVDMMLMFIGFIGAASDGISTAMVLFYTSRMLNTIGNAPTLGSKTMLRNLNKSTMGMLHLACVLWVACFLEGYCWTRTGERQAARMRVKYLKAVLRQDVEYFDLHVSTTSDVITTISNDSLIIQDVLSEKVPNFLRRVFTFIGFYLVAFILLWRLAIVALPLAFLLIFTVLFSGRSLMRLAKKIRGENSIAGTIVQQAISSIRTVYAFGGEKKIVEELSQALNGTTKLGLRQGVVKGLAIGSKGTVFAIWSAMAYYGSTLVIHHHVQGGTIFAVGSSIVHGAMELGFGLSILKDIAEACSAGKRINEMIKRVPKIDSDNLEGKILEDVSGFVEFKHVKFAYPSRPESIVCNNLCLTIPAGKSIALVGPSGCGKSTVLSLLQRFYDPREGEIVLDGVAIDKLQLKWLRSQMALVSQEPSLLSTTIKENILFGKENASMEAVVEAANASNAHNFICELPQGYDSQVGERGAQLSGGQKQRIAIARSIIRKPRILLLDEATSALDYESERAVQVALDKVAVGRTTIIISHRLSTIKDADIIAVIKDGQVRETGSHNELIREQNGLYNSLFHQKTENELQSTPNECLFHSSSSASNNDLNKTKIRSSSKANQSSSDNSSILAYQASLAKLDAIKDPKLPPPSFWRLLSLNSPEWKQATIGCLSAIFYGAIQPLFSFTMGFLIFVFFLTDHEEIKHKTNIYALCFLGLSVFALLLPLIQHFSFAYMGEYLTKRTRERILSKILTFEVGWFDRTENSTGIICSRIAKDANAMRSLLGDRISLLVQSCAAVIIAWTLGLFIAWRLAIIMIATQPLVIACFYTRSILLKTMSKKAIKAQDETCKLASEAVSNLRTITAFSSQDRILKMLKDAQDGPHKESIRQSWFAGFGLAFSQSFNICTWCMYYWYGGRLLSNGYLIGRELFQTMVVIIQTGHVIADAGSTTLDLAKGFDAVNSIFVVLDRDSGIEPENPQGNQPEQLNGHLEFHDVHFAYPTRPDLMIFQGFSINIEAGKSTALVGQSGSGKSTIIGLIERFYDPQKGSVEIDGQDIRSYHLRSLRKHIAFVNQEPTLFAGTIRENIVYGAPKEMTETEIIEAAKVANANDFISGLKDGYETCCGDKGIQLSGGQKQRIAIARAILRNPTILLLDEATSALDSQSEKMVQSALENAMVGRTIVAVAHRLTSIKNCDVIVVLEKGMVVEKGTHSALIAKGSEGAYYSLWSVQKSKGGSHINE